jgi:hypothetical protein
VKFVLTDWFALDLAKILYKGKGRDLPLLRKRTVYLEALAKFAKKKRQIRNWSRPLRESASRSEATQQKFVQPSTAGSNDSSSSVRAVRVLPTEGQD